MRILILTAIPFWHPGTNELIDELRARAIHVDALDIFHGYFFNSRGETKDLVMLPKFFRRLYLRIFRARLLKRFAVDYDIVDIHFVEPYYAKYILELENKLICTLFGSDLFRTNQSQKELQLPIFARTNRIVLSRNMVQYFESHFPGNSNKFYFCQYGSKRLELIASNRPKIRTNNTPIKIACGYNNKHQQQHSLIINELDKMPDKWKERVHLIFPMTYGDDFENVNSVKKRLESSSYSFEIIEKRLTDSEVSDLWLSCDIVINAQTTDALASSIKEAFAAGCVLLTGDWLPYSVYKDLGVYFRSFNFSTLQSELLECLENLEIEKIDCGPNKDKILMFASWNVLIEDWIFLYKSVLCGGK